MNQTEPESAVPETPAPAPAQAPVSAQVPVPAQPPVSAQRPSGIRAFLQTARQRILADIQNPVVLKEMRSAMRGIRPTIMLSIYVAILGGVIGMVYLTAASTDSVTNSADLRQTLGKAIFYTLVSLEMVMVCFLAPALSAGAISAERERQTYDLLRTTLLSSRSLVTGKLSSSVLFLWMMLMVGFPLQSIAYFLGGVSIEEVLISFLMLGISAVIFCTIGIIISSIMRTTLAATVVSYIVTNAVLLGAPMILALLLFMVSALMSNINTLSQAQELILQYIAFAIGYILICLNPLSASIASEIMLVEEQQLFFTTIDVSGSYKFPVISPWITFTIFAILASLLLIRLAVLVVHRVER